MQIPFGKYRGRDLADIPDDYLAWVLDNLDSLSPTLRRAIEQRLGLAEPATNGHPGRPPPEGWAPPPPGVDRQALDSALKAWFRRLSLQWHPDRGGDGKVMAALIQARKELLAFIDDLKR